MAHAIEELLGEEETSFFGCCHSRVGSVTKIFGGEDKSNEIVNVEIEFIIKHSIDENQVYNAMKEDIGRELVTFNCSVLSLRPVTHFRHFY